MKQKEKQKDKKSYGKDLVARLLVPQETNSVVGGEFVTYAQFDQVADTIRHAHPLAPRG